MRLCAVPATKLARKSEMVEQVTWNRYSSRSITVLDVIVDPMIYRTADVFLRAKSGVSKTLHSSEQVRKAINRNVDSLATFFDLFILSENLPIIDYGITFDPHVGLDSSEIIEKSNQAEKVLISVHVRDQASSEARQVALDLMKNKTAIPEPLAKDLREEMSALEYEWKPDLSPLSGALAKIRPI